MYQQIKTLADEAVALQNKDRMDAALREISALCDMAAHDLQPVGMSAEQFEAAELAQHQTRNDTAAVVADMKAQNAVGIAVVPLLPTGEGGAQ